MEGAKSKRPKDTAFRQQNLKAWRPILTPKLVILLFLGVGCIFVPIGIAVLLASNSVIEVDSVDYSQACKISEGTQENGFQQVDNNPCLVELHIPKRMEPPIYMYYKLTNYYQNHRRYVKSRSDMQLRGLDVGEADLNTSCQHRVVDSDFNYSTLINDEQRIISPCGLIAWSAFNDSFDLLQPNGDSVLDATSSRGIAWESDVDVKFKNAGGDKPTDVPKVPTGQNFPHFYWEKQQSCDAYAAQNKLSNSSTKYNTCVTANAGWCFRGSGYCAEDQHFIVWMRTAGLPTFRKLYAKINRPLEPGMYKVKVSNGQLFGQPAFYYNPYLSKDSMAFDSTSDVLPTNQTQLYPVHSFGGTKAIVLSTSSWIGGKNGFLGGAYLTVGIICIVLATGFAIKQNFFPR